MEYDLECWCKSSTLLIMILLAADVSALISLFKETGALLIGVGFVCAGLAVLKKIITRHENAKNAIITYIVALVIYFLIWSLI